MILKITNREKILVLPLLQVVKHIICYVMLRLNNQILNLLEPSN